MRWLCNDVQFKFMIIIIGRRRIKVIRCIVDLSSQWEMSNLWMESVPKDTTRKCLVPYIYLPKFSNHFWNYNLSGKIKNIYMLWAATPRKVILSKSFGSRTFALTSSRSLTEAESHSSKSLMSSSAARSSNSAVCRNTSLTAEPIWRKWYHNFNNVHYFNLY